MVPRSVLLGLLPILATACGGLLEPSAGTEAGSATNPEICRPLTPATEVTVDPAFQGAYSAFRLSAVPGLPSEKYGGMALKAGDPSTLLIAQGGTEGVGAVYAVKVARSCGHIVDFDGTATRIASAPNIDGSIAFAPNGALLFTGWPTNTLGVIPSGESAPRRTLNLTPLGVTSSVGTLTVVPPGFPNAGDVRIVSLTTGDYYEAALVETIDSYELAYVTRKLTLPGGPEGVAYVPHLSPRFDGDAMIVSEWDSDSVAAYPIDAAGDPIVERRAPMLTNVKGAEGALFDPATGDFLFSTWNSLANADQLYAVHGFAAGTK